MPIRSHLLLFASGRGLPPIHFGKEVSLERTRLRIACQSDFDELVSMASRPVKGWFGRTKVIITIVQAQASRPIELGAALEL